MVVKEGALLELYCDDLPPLRGGEPFESKRARFVVKKDLNSRSNQVNLNLVASKKKKPNLRGQMLSARFSCIESSASFSGVGNMYSFWSQRGRKGL